MAPVLNPYAQPYYYQHPYYYAQSSISLYGFPPCFFLPPLVLQNNTTFYAHQYDDHLRQIPIKLLLPPFNFYLAHRKLLHGHGSSTATEAFHLEVSVAETNQVLMMEQEEEGDVHVEREASSGTTVVKRYYCNKRCQRAKVQNKYPSTSTACVDDDFEFKDLEDTVSRRVTTVMIKNLPNKLDKNYILKLLDEHCLAVNEKLQAGGDDGSAFSEFDFLYLPIDFKTESNLGFAFVNFNSPTAAYRLYQEFDRKSWAYLGSNKQCEVKCARIQGLTELFQHFRNSTFSCASIEYLPVHFTPSRNGFRVFPSQQYIGKHNRKQN